MRIVVVSAHYPPNFVSGGTLQPQRIARALRDRGHEVSVYAGWLGEGHEAGSTWDDTDETGLPIRWIATTPWTGWERRENFDNPLVAEDFRTHLARLRPDVVHLHALQSLGASLVPIAKAGGASVAVTMHDFWWCCARQFLVDRDLRPCSIVVDAGSCDCSVDHGWLQQRNAHLREQLAAADVVLTSSASAAAVLRANGVALDRLEVDENGVPAAENPPVPARVVTADRPVRFVYAGGPDELKGVRILFDAFAGLRETTGWQLVAYGVEPWLRDEQRQLDEATISVRPPFAADESAAVFDDADVLVVPSIARESHSLVTREALARGLAVVTSDCVGPEEVVVNGGNGLVVPSADAAALRDALSRVVQDRALLGQLLSDGTAVRVRSLDDQVDGLEARFQTLCEAGATTGETRRVTRVLFVAGIDGAPLRYRVWLPAEGLSLLGVSSDVRWFTDPDLPELVDQADALVVYRVPATDWMIDVVERARRRGLPILFDADDLIFDPDVARQLRTLDRLGDEDKARYLQGVDRYRTMLEHCDAYIASTATLATHEAEIVGKPVFRFDNGVGIELARAAEHALGRPRTPGPLRLGYFSGTDTHDLDWLSIESSVARVLDRHLGVELWLGGHLARTDMTDRLHTRVRRLPFVPWRELPGILRDVDVNLAPLVLGDRFNEAKSAIKWLEAALVRTPTVASATEPFRDAIDHARNGFLAASEDEWGVAIESLIRDAALQQRVGRQAQRDALLRCSPHLQARRYAEILESAQTTIPRTDWPAVIVHEQPRRHQLEPYARHVARSDRRGARWRDARRRVRAAVDRHGTAGALVRVPRAAARAVARTVLRRSG